MVRRAVLAVVLVGVWHLSAGSLPQVTAQFVEKERLDDTSIELDPVLLDSVVWPWKQQHQKGLEVAYEDGELVPGWEDSSWDSRIAWDAACPQSALLNVTDDTREKIGKQVCIEASARKHGGLSFTADKPFGKNSALDFWIFIPDGDDENVHWQETVQRVQNENVTAAANNKTRNTFHDMCSNDTAGAQPVSKESSAICPAVRLLAGPIGEEDPAELSPLLLFLHSAKKGSDIFSAPLLTMAPDLKLNDWSHVVIPLGASGWGGGKHDWKRLSLMPNTHFSHDGIRFYIGQFSVKVEAPKAIVSQSKINATAAATPFTEDLTAEDAVVITENQAARLEEVAVQLKDIDNDGDREEEREDKDSSPDLGKDQANSEKGAEIITAAPLTPPQQVVRYLYSSQNNGDSDGDGFPEGVSDWSWLANVSNSDEGNLCANLESFGGLSLKTIQPFAKASAIKFMIRPPKTRFFINENGRVQPVISIRLDATKEKYVSPQASEGGLTDQAQSSGGTDDIIGGHHMRQKKELFPSRPSWQTFVTTELIPLQYATPSLVKTGSNGDDNNGWIPGVLPLAGFGDHNWDRISWIDATGERGGDSGMHHLCIDNVTVEYTMTVDENAKVPSLGELLNSSALNDVEGNGDTLHSRFGNGGYDEYNADYDSSDFVLLSELCSNSTTGDIKCDGGQIDPSTLKSKLNQFQRERSQQLQASSSGSGDQQQLSEVASFAGREDMMGLSDYASSSVMLSAALPDGQNDSSSGPAIFQSTTFLILMIAVAATLLISITAMACVLVNYKMHKDRNIVPLLSFWQNKNKRSGNGPYDGSVSVLSHSCSSSGSLSGGGPERIQLKEIDCNFDYSQAIGVGSTCAVFKGKWRGQDVAIKAIHWQTSGNGNQWQRDLQRKYMMDNCREIEYLSLPQCNGSPFVIKMKAFAHHEDTTYLVLEYCKHGNLQALMKSGALKMDSCRTLKFLRDICLGLQHLNDASISHRDVKSSNVLVQCSHCNHASDSDCLSTTCEPRLVAKLGDLGVSKLYDSLHQTELQTFCGTPRWMAPERLQLQASDRSSLSSCASTCAAKCDVYSFGILAWEIVNYQITNRYELPFEDIVSMHKSLGVFVDGVYDSYNDGTVFNTSVTPGDSGLGSVGHGLSVSGGDCMASGIQARPNSLASSWNSDANTGTNANANANAGAGANAGANANADANAGAFGKKGSIGRRGQAQAGGLQALKSNIWNASSESSLYTKIIQGARPSIPDDCSGPLADLIRECWKGDPAQRPCFADVAKRLELLMELN